MKGYNIFVGLVFLLSATAGLQGADIHFLRLPAASDVHNCTSIDQHAFIRAVIQQLEGQGGVHVFTYCDEGCVDNGTETCQHQHTTYTLVLKVSGRQPATGANISVVGKEANGFVCSNIYNVPEYKCNSTWQTSTTHQTTSGTGMGQIASVTGMGQTASVTGKKQTQLVTQPTPEPRTGTTEPPDKKLGLKVGIPVALAALAGTAAAAGMLYRKLRKQNGVSDESDTSGILGGTPVVSMEEAPNSVPPAGTA